MKVVGKSIVEAVNYKSSVSTLMLPLGAKMFPPTAPVVKIGSHSMLDPCTTHAH